MSEWLDPSGLTSFGIGICDRCKQKFSITELYPDPNAPGLRVCIADMDAFDPYRLPARQTENITLPFTRPDVPLTDGDDGTAHAFLIGVDADSALGTDTGTEALEATGVS